MKKFICTAVTFAMIVASITACGGKTTETQAPATEAAQTVAVSEAQETEAATEAAAGVDFSGDYEDMGDGTAYIACASGTSQDGNVPVLFESADTVLEQIEIDSEGMDGSHLSYIYIDGIETAKEQLADSQVSLDLQGDALKEGTHKVEVVQYDSDEPGGTVITYKTAAYEVKNK
nr:MAG TPA: lipoprotein [Caudoviricetes sp.]